MKKRIRLIDDVYEFFTLHPDNSFSVRMVSKMINYQKRDKLKMMLDTLVWSKKLKFDKLDHRYSFRK